MAEESSENSVTSAISNESQLSTGGNQMLHPTNIGLQSFLHEATFASEPTKAPDAVSSLSSKNMFQCWAEALTRMTELNGRTTCYEFWAFQSVSLVIFLLLALIGYLLSEPKMVMDIFAVYFLLPAVSLSVRRLHDISMSGWWTFPIVVLALLTLIAWNLGVHNMVLLLFATLVYGSYLFNLLRQQGDKEDNKYGAARNETEPDYLESRAFISFMTTFLVGLWIIYAAYLLKF